MRHIEKSRPDFSICLIEIFSCGGDFSKNVGDFLKKLVDFLKNLAALLWFGQVGDSLVAPVAFSVALPNVKNAPGTTNISSSCRRR